MSKDFENNTFIDCSHDDSSRQADCRAFHWIEAFSLFGLILNFSKREDCTQDERTSFESSTTESTSQLKFQTGPEPAAQDFVLVVQSGMMKARVNDSPNFVRLYINSDCLYWKEWKDTFYSTEGNIYFSDIISVTGSPQQSEKKRVLITLLAEKNEQSTTQLDFERTQEAKAFARGLKKLLKTRSMQYNSQNQDDTQNQGDTAPNSPVKKLLKTRSIRYNSQAQDDAQSQGNTDSNSPSA